MDEKTMLLDYLKELKQLHTQKSQIVYERLKSKVCLMKMRKRC